MTTAKWKIVGVLPSSDEFEVRMSFDQSEGPDEHYLHKVLGFVIFDNGSTEPLIYDEGSVTTVTQSLSAEITSNFIRWELIPLDEDKQVEFLGTSMTR